MRPRLVQITAGAARGDAVTNYVRHLGARLEATGWFVSTRIFAENIAENCPGRIRHICLYTPRPRDVIIYHHSVGLRYLSSVLFPHVRPLLIYHNITPAHFYVPWDLRAAGRMALGRAQLPVLAAVCDHAIALSEFSAGELRRAGFADVHVNPYPGAAGLLRRPGRPFVAGMSGLLATESVQGPHGDIGEPGRSVAAAAASAKSGSVHRVLFVGRIAPNKRVEWVLQVFRRVRQRMHAAGRDVRLVVVGALRDDAYCAYVRRLCHEMGLDDYVDWTGYVSEEALGRLWAEASVYLSMSEHEGFGVPLLEAMSWDVPVVALCGPGSSVGEVLGDAGLGFAVPSFDRIADAVRKTLVDGSLRQRIVSKQRLRLVEIETQDATAAVLRIVERMRHDR